MNVYQNIIEKDFDPMPEDEIRESLFQQYGRVITESIASSFGLDFLLIQDRYGGDVDTIHNVRKIGLDPQMEYKSKKNEQDYDGPYKKPENKLVVSKYRNDKRYIEKRKETTRQQESGNLKDAYTGKKIEKGEDKEVDHVISLKEIHEDRGRNLANLKVVDLAHSNENLQATTKYTNGPKSADSMDKFLKKSGYRYTAKEKRRMIEKDKKARKAYEQKIVRAYYSSPKFQKDVAYAAGKVSLAMGAREAVGLIFTEIWFSVRYEFELSKNEIKFELKEFFLAIARGIKNGFEIAKKKYKELFSKFLNGAIGGALANVTTTLCNIFFTTAKNIVKIIRESWVSLTEATKVLFINPEGYSSGDKIRAVLKILSTGASVIVGSLVSEAISKTGIEAIPIVGNLVSSFCGVFVTGIMSCTLLYFFDRNPLVNKLISWLNNLPTMDNVVNYYKNQVKYFEEYAAQLLQIDIEQFKKEVSLYHMLVNQISHITSERQLNKVLYSYAEKLGILFSWQKTHKNFDEFMGDKNAVMVFE